MPSLSFVINHGPTTSPDHKSLFINSYFHYTFVTIMKKKLPLFATCIHFKVKRIIKILFCQVTLIYATPVPKQELISGERVKQ